MLDLSIFIYTYKDLEREGEGERQKTERQRSYEFYHTFGNNVYHRKYVEAKDKRTAL